MSITCGQVSFLYTGVDLQYFDDGDLSMGNNAAFTSFEAAVIAVYNHSLDYDFEMRQSGMETPELFLNRELLDALAASYSGMDIDRGGMEGTLTNDGLDIDGVICKVYGIELPPYPDIPDRWTLWTDEQRDANDAWQEAKYEAINKLEIKWGWD